MKFSRIVPAVSVVLVVPLAGAAQFRLARSTSDAGGGRMMADGWELQSTTGQADTDFMSGGSFSITGGFWIGVPLGDCEDDGDIDLGDHDAFTECVSGPVFGNVANDCRCLDMNNNHTVDLADFAVIQRIHMGGLQ